MPANRQAVIPQTSRCFNFNDGLVRWLVAIALLAATVSTTEAAELTLEPTIDLPLTVAITHAGDDRLFLTTIDGQVRLYQDGALRPGPFLDIRNRIRGQGLGLWSVAFHPDFASNGFVFAHYAELVDGASVISRFRLAASGDRLDPASEKVLLRIDKVQQLHYGGQLQFGPDGMLYISTGDSSSSQDGPDPRCVAQSLTSLEGKILRLDVDQNADVAPYHAVPADNPFRGVGRGEIWAYGLRNPWRFSFDREAGDLWLTDVGENRHEEIDFEPATGPSRGGRNYGWKVMEGEACFNDLSGCGSVPPCGDPGLTSPTIDYEHTGGRCAVIGGHVYRGRLVPSLFGKYLYGDFCTGELWAAGRQDTSWTVDSLPIVLSELSSFGEDVDGELWLVAGSTVYRLVDRDLPAQGLVELEATSYEVAEDAGELAIGVRRLGGSSGAVRTTIRVVEGTATAGEDFVAQTTELAWADGELGVKTFTLEIRDDPREEIDETLRLELDPPTGGAVLGGRAVSEVRIRDDEGCVASTTALCLSGERFRVEVDWRTHDSGNGVGQTRVLTDAGGYFWFFSPDNPELFVKILNACEINGYFWVFAAGLTDVETHLEITDTARGVQRVWDDPLGQLFSTVRDLKAFDCP